LCFYEHGKTLGWLPRWETGLVSISPTQGCYVDVPDQLVSRAGIMENTVPDY